MVDNVYSLIAGLKARTSRPQMAVELVSALSEAFAEDRLGKGLTVSIELLPTPELKVLAALTVSRAREAFIVHGEPLIPVLQRPEALGGLERLVRYVCLTSMAAIGRAAGAFRTIVLNPHLLDMRAVSEENSRRPGHACIVHRGKCEVRGLSEVSFDILDLGPPPTRTSGLGVGLRC